MFNFIKIRDTVLILTCNYTYLYFCVGCLYLFLFVDFVAGCFPILAMTSYRRFLVVSLISVYLILGLNLALAVAVDVREQCICFSLMQLHSCECTEHSIDYFNNHQLYDSLVKLLKKDCFRYYKVDMERECPFWKEERFCSTGECGIENCDDAVPEAWKYTKPLYKEHHLSSHQRSSRCDESNDIDPLDKHISRSQREEFAKWTAHDEQLWDNFCDVGDEASETLHFVDLTLNPERYTGYKGNSAQRVWKCIYEENCFKPDPKFDRDFLIYPNVRGLCSEKRAFYSIISGLHTSITISIASNNFQPSPGGFGAGRWVRNVDMFKYRFGAEYTNGEGPERLKNLYFVYLLELRALQKVAPYLHHSLFYTGDDERDMETMDEVSRFVQTVEAFRNPFKESTLFQGNANKAMTLKEEFRRHFLNISRIMDCVDCDKCRLWGKLQTHGIGTALKILFSDLPKVHDHQRRKRHFQLQRNDVVALFNSFGRFSSSIKEISEFNKLLYPSN
ncbi:Endoplasmic oxidoreductin-1 [Trichinella spiralis]|uniref:Endoplasmic oxidoreductin-1 n=1 Tax=Trichinella spiralis TaxID=6334 RepID=A0A0V1B065_TRISP|nr:Endoplasmic oxidoreductin-1 [Trichinella spiralis]